MTVKAENVKRGIDPECGCEIVKCLIWPFCVEMHLESDGTGDAFFDAGDDDFEINFRASNMTELISASERYVQSLYCKGLIE